LETDKILVSLVSIFSIKFQRLEGTVYLDFMTPDFTYRESAIRWLTGLCVSRSKLWACK